MSHTATFRSWPEASGWLQRLHEWVRRNTESGRPVTIVAKEQKRTLEQNSLIHPVAYRLAAALGRKSDKESMRVFRRLLVELWEHETGREPQFERSLDGKRWVSVDKGTSDLDKPDCSEFIEWLLQKESEIAA